MAFHVLRCPRLLEGRRCARTAGTRRPAGAVLLSCLAVALSGCERVRPVVIGVSTSPPFVQAARMAVDDELVAGGVPGLDTVMMPESRSLAAPAIETARRLVAVAGMTAVVGHSNSAASLAAAPIYNDHEVVQITPTASAPAFSRAGRFSFRLVPYDDRQGRFLAEYVGEALPDGGRLAVVYVNDDYGRGLRAALLASLDAERFPVVVELPHVENDLRDADAAYAAGALRAARPDVVLWLARGGTLAGFLPSIRAVLPDVPIVGGDAVEAGGLQAAPRELWGDIRSVAYVDLDATEALRSFTRRFRDRFGRDPTGPDALTYDAVRLVIAGLRAGARTGPELRAYLMTLGRASPPYAGLTGPIVFDDAGDVERSYVLETMGRARPP